MLILKKLEAKENNNCYREDLLLKLEWVDLYKGGWELDGGGG